MSDKTNIEWTDATWNPIRGCSRVSEGCRNCYAEGMAARFSGPGLPYEGLAHRIGGDPRWTGKVIMAPDTVLTQPLRWKRGRKIFVNSMSDLWHEGVSDEWRDKIFAVAALTPHHTHQMLTKRSDLMNAYLSDPRRSHKIARVVLDLLLKGLIPKGYLNDGTYDAIWPVDGGEEAGDVWLKTWPLPNVWLGVSIEDQATADERVPHLLETPAAIRFVSAEPLLGPIDLRNLAFPTFWQKCECTDHPTTINALDASVYCEGCCEGPESMSFGRINWVIDGGESGPKARITHPDCHRSLRDQCADYDTPFFFKQWGEWLPMDGHREFMDLPPGQRPWKMIDGALMVRVGKKTAGHLLDGVEHRAFPVIGGA